VRICYADRGLENWHRTAKEHGRFAKTAMRFRSETWESLYKISLKNLGKNGDKTKRVFKNQRMSFRPIQEKVIDKKLVR
jgi:hypothetical protein